MRRPSLLLLCVAITALAGCGLKGPLVPPPPPSAPAPAATVALPAHAAVPASTPP